MQGLLEARLGRNWSFLISVPSQPAPHSRRDRHGVEAGAPDSVRDLTQDGWTNFTGAKKKFEGVDWVRERRRSNYNVVERARQPTECALWYSWAGEQMPAAHESDELRFGL